MEEDCPFVRSLPLAASDPIHGQPASKNQSSVGHCMTLMLFTSNDVLITVTAVAFDAFDAD